MEDNEHKSPEIRSGERYKQQQQAKRDQQARLGRSALVGGAAVLLVALGAITYSFIPPRIDAGPSGPMPIDALATDFLLPPEAFNKSDVAAVVEGVAITERDIANHFQDVYGQTTDLPEDARTQALEALTARIQFAREAIRFGFNKDPDFQAIIRRHYVRTLAGRFLATRLGQQVSVTRDEIDAFITENPHMFEARLRYSFDAADIARADMILLDSKAVRRAGSIDAVLSQLADKSVDFTRRPFFAFSEDLPAVIRDELPALLESGDLFFLTSGDGASIVHVLAIDPAPVMQMDQASVARSIMLQQRRADRLEEMERAILEGVEMRLAGELTPAANPKTGAEPET